MAKKVKSSKKSIKPTSTKTDKKVKKMKGSAAVASDADMEELDEEEEAPKFKIKIKNGKKVKVRIKPKSSPKVVDTFEDFDDEEEAPKPKATKKGKAEKAEKPAAKKGKKAAPEFPVVVEFDGKKLTFELHAIEEFESFQYEEESSPAGILLSSEDTGYSYHLMVRANGKKFDVLLTGTSSDPNGIDVLVNKRSQTAEQVQAQVFAAVCKSEEVKPPRVAKAKPATKAKTKTKAKAKPATKAKPAAKGKKPAKKGKK